MDVIGRILLPPGGVNILGETRQGRVYCRLINSNRSYNPGNQGFEATMSQTRWRIFLKIRDFCSLSGCNQSQSRKSGILSWPGTEIFQIKDF